MSLTAYTTVFYAAANVLRPLSTSDRVCLGGATDDGTSKLQVNGKTTLDNSTITTDGSGILVVGGRLNATSQLVAGPITSIDQYGTPDVAPFVLNTPFKNGPPAGSTIVMWLKTDTDPLVDSGAKPSECKIRLDPTTASAPTLTFQTGQHEISNAGTISLQHYGGDVILGNGGGNNYINPGGSGFTAIGSSSDDSSGAVLQVAGDIHTAGGLICGSTILDNNAKVSVDPNNRQLFTLDGVGGWTAQLDWNVLGSVSALADFDAPNMSTAGVFSAGAGQFSVDASGNCLALSFKDNTFTPVYALVADSGKYITSSATSQTELEYLVGVTSAIQTQLDAKQAGPLTGDVTTSGAAVTIASNAVTLAKMATMATASLLGRNTAGTGNVEVLSATTVSSILGAPKCLFDHYADVNNGTTVETDLYSDTVTAGQLAANGDKISAQYQVVCAGAVTATQDMRVYFGGTKIYDSGALSIGAVTSNFTFNVTVIRESSSVVRCNVSASTDFATLFPYSTYTRITGLTLANTQVLKITGQAGGAAGASNQITAKDGYVQFIPHA